MKNDNIDYLLPFLGIALAIALAGWGLSGAASFLAQFYHSIVMPSIRFADVLIANYGRGIAEATVLIALGSAGLRFGFKQTETLAIEFSKATQGIVAESQRLNEKLEGHYRTLNQLHAEKIQLKEEVESLNQCAKELETENCGLKAEIEDLKHPERREQARLEEERRAMEEKLKAYASNAQWGGV
ncbi:MAG TPA: hypothetical protein DCS07_00070 [Bdellovibrionales bacterium]|nr:MAG: hypothetical protein A2Z97_01025 [Bdellovibrionales bacterium GWB1_52_6]OFZ03107.1 MAG: hypothetical protein A2X97_09725 [Bdellovibrionales bacterium GWA1_52_35]OFZ41324.1 MAG: hypothetical protein A2070_09040 [Bdellovibrionales bacterium GWC1_52_8]HAR41028.1 hypothetical protein [Bdellovibrionales bacterium]HCM40435.1 hypothetical protein [Bdellovibrionales bacterium]